MIKNGFLFYLICSYRPLEINHFSFKAQSKIQNQTGGDNNNNTN